ncbi:TetR/AcrR family transcriptional regulator [Streptomyces sp. NPDC096311]|uniref:TetR/AcrR family transcriptional regulator n=1 Tax=Streptomyces sp. NPDC096311 TaxID=3366083 RepID=UPI0038305CAA
MSEPATTRRNRMTPMRAAELYEAVLHLLREVGYDGLSMEAVATRTRSSKATLYRQWGGKPQLVAEALRYRTPITFDTIDTGSLRGDLSELVAQTDETEIEMDAALRLGVGRAIYDQPELRRTMREVMIAPAIEGISGILLRGVARGEVPEDNPAIDLVPEMLVSIVISRPMLTDAPMSRAELKRYVEAMIFPALGV